jgi:hypothetical protein
MLLLFPTLTFTADSVILFLAAVHHVELYICLSYVSKIFIVILSVWPS